MKSYWSSADKGTIVIVMDDGEYHFLYPLEAGVPSSLADHVDPALATAAASPLSNAEWESYLAAERAKAEAALKPAAPLTPVQKLQAAGLTVEELKVLLAS